MFLCVIVGANDLYLGNGMVALDGGHIDFCWNLKESEKC